MTETHPVSETLRLEQPDTLDKVQGNTNVCCLINAQITHSVQWLCYRPDVREIVLISFNDAYISSVIKERKSAEKLWDDSQREKVEIRRRKCSVAVPLCAPRTPHELAWGSNSGHWGKRQAINSVSHCTAQNRSSIPVKGNCYFSKASNRLYGPLVP
jgi:hypothetical protein